MTIADLDRIEALARKATKGKRRSTADTKRDDVPVDLVLLRGEVLAEIWPEGHGCYMTGYRAAQRDGRFIAAADPATVIELCRLARRGMDAAVAGR